MKTTAGRFRATVVRGLIAIVPLGVVAYLVAQVGPVVVKAAGALDGVLPFGPVTNLAFGIAAMLLAVILFCFAVGALLGTGPGNALKRAMDGFLEGTIPLYGAARKLAERVTGTEGEEFAPVEVDLYDSAARVLGLFIEALPDERCAVFVPMAPTPAAGQVYVVPRDRVAFLGVAMRETLGAVSEWGVGASKLYPQVGEGTE